MHDNKQATSICVGLFLLFASAILSKHDLFSDSLIAVAYESEPKSALFKIESFNQHWPIQHWQ